MLQQTLTGTWLTMYPRTIKHTKAYESLADAHPTIWNKPSGLINTWYDIATTPSPHQTPTPQHGNLYNPSHSVSWSHMDNEALFPPLSPLSQVTPPLQLMLASQLSPVLQLSLSSQLSPSLQLLPSSRFSPVLQLLLPSQPPFPQLAPPQSQFLTSLQFSPLSQHPPTLQITEPFFAQQLLSLPRPYVKEDGTKGTVGIHTGGKPLFTYWVCTEYMMGSETKYPAWTHQVHFDYFCNSPPIRPPKYPPGTC